MKKILVIEDNAEVRENMAEILMLSNYEVVTAANGKEGVETALAHGPDLILCDIMMPVLDGYGVLHLLGRHEATATIPFIFLTAKAEKTDLRKGMEMGADDYLTKPFDGTELLNAVKIRLKKAAALQQKAPAGVQEVYNLIDEAKQKGLLQLTRDEHAIYSYGKKHRIYTEGGKPKAVYYLVSGKVKLFKTSDEGKELIVTVLRAGEFFGYLPVLQEMTYTDNAEVLEDAEVTLIPRTDFMQLVSADAKISGQFIKLMTHHIVEREEDLVNLAYNTLRKKVAYGIVRLGEKYKTGDDKKVVIYLSRENMAQAIGVATESLIRTLSDFKAEGLVELGTGKVTLLNEGKLRDLPY